MNERIKELAEQAEIQVTEVEPITGETIKYYEFSKEKFAELIVRECVSLIRKQSIGTETLGGQRFKTVQLGETIATIEEHFGIE